MSRPPELLDGPYELLARLGRDRGCRIVLSGAGGDEWLLPPPGYAADCVLRLDLHALVDLYRASAGYWPQSRRLDTARRVLWRGGIRAAGRSLVNTAAARLAPAVLARTRRSRASSRLPSWAVPDRQTRDLLVTRIAEATNQEPPHGALETQRRELLSGANSSTAREAAFETQSRVGVISQAPLLDPDVVGFLYHLPPHRLTEEGQAKAPARRLLARYLPDLVAAWPRTVYADSFWLNTVEEEAPSAWAASAEPLAGLADLGLLEPKTARSRLTGGGATPTELVTAWRALSLGWWIQGVGTRDDRL
jgi:hypothetical protein